MRRPFGAARDRTGAGFPAERRMTVPDPPRLPHVRQFDGLRGLLALWVAASHVLCWCGWAGADPAMPFARAVREALFAPAAVSTFIILSGFAISFLLHERRPSYRAS